MTQAARPSRGLADSQVVQKAAVAALELLASTLDFYLLEALTSHQNTNAPVAPPLATAQTQNPRFAPSLARPRIGDKLHSNYVIGSGYCSPKAAQEEGTRMRMAIKKWKLATLFASTGIYGWALPLHADIFVISLPAKKYSAGQDEQLAIDLGTSLLSVQSVTLHCAGDATAGVGPAGPFDCFFYAYLTEYPASAAYATLSSTGAATYPSPTPFNADIPFRAVPNWNFLLDGRVDVSYGISWVKDFPNLPYQSLPSITTSSATITIIATPVPEPATLSLALLAAIPLLRRMRRH